MILGTLCTSRLASHSLGLPCRNVCLGSFADIHEWLLSARSGRSDKPFHP